MANVSLWSGVDIKMQSALATALPITSISKANPGVVTYTGTDPTAGDYLLLYQIVGMAELDGRVVRAGTVNATGNTVELEGIDTTLYGTFISGSLKVITFGVTLATATGLTLAAAISLIDVTTDRHGAETDSRRRECRYLQLENIWDTEDPGLLAAKAASDIKAQLAFGLPMPTGRRSVFTSYVAAPCAGRPGAGQGHHCRRADHVRQADDLRDIALWTWESSNKN
jgi:hypothetical protein